MPERTPVRNPVNSAEPVILVTQGGQIIDTSSGGLSSIDQPYKSATIMTIGGADVSPGRAIQINVSTAGNFVLRLSDNTTITVPLAVGYNVIPYSVKAVVSATGAASAIYRLD